MSGDVRGPNRSDNLFPFAYVSSRDTPAEAKKSLLLRCVAVRPFRKQYPDESWLEYRAHKCAYYLRAYKTMIIAFCLLFVAYSVLYIARPASDGSANIELDIRPFGRETIAARALLNSSELLVVYATTKCSPLTKYTKRLQASRDLCVACMRSNPLHEDNRDMAAFAVFASTLMDSNSLQQMPCVCAPALGYMVNMVAMRSMAVLRNVKLVDTSKMDRIVRHSQAAQFDIPDSFLPIHDATSDVLIVRASSIEVQHETDYGNELSTFQDEDAFCVQECLDLLSGESIWDVALRQQIAENQGVEQYKC